MMMYLEDEGICNSPGRAQRFVWGAISRDSIEEAISVAWKILTDPDAIIARLAQATEGLSGRALKNMVTVATKTAMRRSLSDPQRRVTLRESDFELIPRDSR